jgi:polyisoprenyl-teichoic acid--peptidoglycan teichoic acid transferase
MPRTRGGVLWRGALAAVLVVGFVAATTAVAGLLQVEGIVNDLKLGGAIKSAQITLPQPGKPQTLLLIGADHRYGQAGGIGNTDTMLLVRLNDSSKTINMLSVPRDLRITLPGIGYAKLNAAYADGGPDLLLQTLETQVFPGIKVNHIVVFSFLGFAKLVDAIGCVYTDVDHRYYNNTAQTDYSSIDIQPGYQKLCGDNGAPDSALAFVRFRHTDSDEVRNARQQDFIRWAKDQYSAGQLVSQRGTLLKIFGEYSQTDKQLQSVDGLLDLFGLAVNADGLELKTIQFPEAFGPCVAGQSEPCYVFPISQALEQQAYTDFITPTASIPSVSLKGIVTSKPKRSKSGKSSKQGKHGKRRAARTALVTGMIPDPSDGQSQAGQLGNVGMPVYYPKDIPDDYAYCYSTTENCIEYPNPASEYDNSYPREYQIDGPGDKKYAAYVMTLVAASGTQTDLATGQYFTVQGTTWQDPPILSKPTLVEHVDGKQLFLYSQGGLISTVAWHTKQGVYWIQNNLQDLIPNVEMVATAASLTRAAS